MGKPKPSMLRHLLRRLESELYSTPVATDVIGRCVRRAWAGCRGSVSQRERLDAAPPATHRYRTETLDSKYPAPTRESLPEDRLYKPFYAKYPQVGQPSRPVLPSCPNKGQTLPAATQDSLTPASPR
jgi:hypothetical protein